MSRPSDEVQRAIASHGHAHVTPLADFLEPVTKFEQGFYVS